MSTTISASEIRELQDFKNVQFAKWGLTDTWEFAWGRAKSQAGSCTHRVYGKGLIRISLVLAHARGVKETMNTILHEIAHALAGPHAKHSYLWKQWAVKVGARPERCFSGDTIDETKISYKYTLTCPNCGETDGCSRKLKRQRACVKCCNEHNYGRFSYTYAYTIKQNY